MTAHTEYLLSLDTVVVKERSPARRHILVDVNGATVKDARSANGTSRFDASRNVLRSR